jgi:hypothetical protein
MARWKKPWTAGNGLLFIGNLRKWTGNARRRSRPVELRTPARLAFHPWNAPRRRWEARTTKTFADAAVGLSVRTVRYWLRDEHLPQDTLTIEDRLFGSNFSSCTVWRFEHWEALEHDQKTAVIFAKRDADLIVTTPGAAKTVQSRGCLRLARQAEGRRGVII